MRLKSARDRVSQLGKIMTAVLLIVINGLIFRDRAFFLPVSQAVNLSNSLVVN